MTGESIAPTPWPRALAIVEAMCEQLAPLHASGIVHRGLGVAAIAVTLHADGRVAVTLPEMLRRAAPVRDPLAVGDERTYGLAQPGVDGMSPEQLMGKPLDGRSDIYALGVIAYVLVTGTLPFPNANGPAGLITAQLKHAVDAPSARLPAAHLPPAVDTLILRCLGKRPDERYADVGELVRAIRDVRAGND